MEVPGVGSTKWFSQVVPKGKTSLCPARGAPQGVTPKEFPKWFPQGGSLMVYTRGSPKWCPTWVVPHGCPKICVPQGVPPRRTTKGAFTRVVPQVWSRKGFRQVDSLEGFLEVCSPVVFPQVGSHDESLIGVPPRAVPLGVPSR